MLALVAQTSSSSTPMLFVGMIAVALVAAVGGLLLMRRWDPQDIDDEDEKRRARKIRVKAQGAFVVVAVLIVLGLIVTAPGDGDIRNALLGLYGVLVTAVIGLTATTHVGNGVAGLILDSRDSFGPGDFIRSGELLGRVTDQRLLHTVIQTEDSDLTLIPNVRLVTEPVTVMRRKEGTIVSSEVSLGYGVHRQRAKKALVEAVKDADLEEPIVLISELGDFSVTYRAGGRLPKTSTFISARSLLREKILDHLHANDIEIVSPTFMNQLQLRPGDRLIPDAPPPELVEEEPVQFVEVTLFDEAEKVESIQDLKTKRSRIDDEIESLQAELKAGGEDDGVRRAEDRLRRLTQLREGLDRRIDESEREPTDA